MSSEVRPFTRDDVPAVADLFVRVFRKSSHPAPDSLKSYFIDLYLNNPWARSAHPSFVACDATEMVRGFVGVIPIPMMIGKRRIIASVAGNNMVDPDLKDPFAGVLLLRKLFASNPTLTISDSANEISRTLWTKLGANVLTLYSMRWVRVLQPSRYMLSLIPGESRISSLKPLLNPLCAVADAAASRFFKPASGPSELSSASGPIQETILREFTGIVGRRALVPEYTKERLGWLFNMASQKEQYGKLFNVVVNDRAGNVAGWYMYYATPGNVAQVLQFAARQDSIGEVLNHLFSHARARRSVAVMGGIETTAVKEFSESRCLFFLRNLYTVAYSQDPEITTALLKGDAFLSRLEGEWWNVLFRVIPSASAFSRSTMLRLHRTPP